MEKNTALLALCTGSSSVTGEFLQRPVTQSFDVFFYLCLNKRLSKQVWGWWFGLPPCPLWRHCNVWCGSVCLPMWACTCACPLNAMSGMPHGGQNTHRCKIWSDLFLRNKSYRSLKLFNLTSFIKRFVSSPFVFSVPFTVRDDRVAAWLSAHYPIGESN